MEAYFENSSLETSERKFIDNSSDYFGELTQILYSELTMTNPLFYCPNHHAMITRAAKKIITKSLAKTF